MDNERDRNNRSGHTCSLVHQPITPIIHFFRGRYSSRLGSGDHQLLFYFKPALSPHVASMRDLTTLAASSRHLINTSTWPAGAPILKHTLQQKEIKSVNRRRRANPDMEDLLSVCCIVFHPQRRWVSRHGCHAQGVGIEGCRSDGHSFDAVIDGVIEVRGPRCICRPELVDDVEQPEVAFALSSTLDVGTDVVGCSKHKLLSLSGRHALVRGRRAEVGHHAGKCLDHVMPALVVVCDGYALPYFRVAAIVGAYGQLDYCVEDAFDGHVLVGQEIFPELAHAMEDEFSLGRDLGISLAKDHHMVIYICSRDKPDFRGGAMSAACPFVRLSDAG